MFLRHIASSSLNRSHMDRFQVHAHCFSYNCLRTEPAHSEANGAKTMAMHLISTLIQCKDNSFGAYWDYQSQLAANFPPSDAGGYSAEGEALFFKRIQFTYCPPSVEAASWPFEGQ